MNWEIMLYRSRWKIFPKQEIFASPSPISRYWFMLIESYDKHSVIIPVTMIVNVNSYNST